MRNRFAMAIMAGALVLSIGSFVEAAEIFRSGPGILILSSVLVTWLWKPLMLFASAAIVEMLARVSDALERAPASGGS